MIKDRQHLEALTTLRFIAAGFIFAHHILGKFGLPRHGEVGLFFGIGVPFFFALSGFILAYNYAPSRDPKRMTQMVLYRIARIWPLHLACLVLFLVFAWSPKSPLQSADQILPNIFLVHSWIGSYYYSFSFNAVSWSLSAELFFYLCFPFLILLRSSMLVIVAVVATVAIVWISDALWVGQPIHVATPSGLAIITTHPLAGLAVFISGILAKRLFDELPKDLPISTATALEAVGIVLFIAFMFYHREVVGLVGQILGARMAFARWLSTGMGIVVFVPVIMVLAYQQGLVSRLMSARWLVYLGEISFAFYLCHQFLLGWLQRTYRLDPVEGVLIGFTLSVALASILHHVIERPCQRWIRNRVDAALAGQAASAPR